MSEQAAQDSDTIILAPHEVEAIIKLRKAGTGGRVVVISDKQYEVISALNTLDFFRAGKERIAVVRFNGSRVIVSDTMQVR